MSDWREEVKGAVDQYIAQKLKASTYLRDVLKELEVVPYQYHTGAVEFKPNPLTWDVVISIRTVGEMKFKISIADFAIEKKDSYGQVLSYELTDNADFHKDKIREIIVRNIKEFLAP